MSLKLYTDKTEIFECNVALEGAAISDSKLRAILKFDDKNLMVEGKIDSNGKGNILLPKLKNISKDFDYILFDCPPALNLLTINAMEFSKKVLVPVQCEYYALEGLVTLKNTIEQLNSALDLKIKIVAILRTMADGRNRLTREVSDQLEKHFKQTVLNTIIPRNVKLSEAPSFGIPAISDKNSCLFLRSLILFLLSGK